MTAADVVETDAGDDTSEESPASAEPEDIRGRIAVGAEHRPDHPGDGDGGCVAHARAQERHRWPRVRTPTSSRMLLGRVAGAAGLNEDVDPLLAQRGR